MLTLPFQFLWHSASKLFSLSFIIYFIITLQKLVCSTFPPSKYHANLSQIVRNFKFLELIPYTQDLIETS